MEERSLEGCRDEGWQLGCRMGVGMSLQEQTRRSAKFCTMAQSDTTI